MKQQILIIHGGNVFDTHEHYLADLKSREVTLDRMRRKGWKDKLQEMLGEDYDVLHPLMPNSQNARYAEWKIWLEKIILLLDEPMILIGHSLGGITLAKYLSENDCPKKIRASFLVAPPYNTETRHPRADFNISLDLQKFSRQGGKIFLYHSRDDEVVPFPNFEAYKSRLPKAETRTFEDRGHFNSDEFPEIVEDIKSLR
jgi:uncharacterized protein